MEQGVYDYLVNTLGVKPSKIQIKSCLVRTNTRNSGLSQPPVLSAASIITLSDVKPDNTTVVDMGASEEKAPTDEELAAGAAALDAEIAAQAAEDWGSNKTVPGTQSSWMRRVSLGSSIFPNLLGRHIGNFSRQLKHSVLSNIGSHRLSVWEAVMLIVQHMAMAVWLKDSLLRYLATSLSPPQPPGASAQPFSSLA